jgi:hypothetical protein
VTAGQRLADRVLAGATDAPLRPIRWPLGSRRAAPIVRAALRLSTPAAPRQPVRGSTVVGSVSLPRVPVPTREESLR